MAEDPLERIEREERERKEKKARNGGLKAVMIVLAVIAAALAATLYYVWDQKTTLVNELEEEKADLTAQMVALQKDFQDLNSEYESINHQLDTSREQVALLIDKLQQTEATNRVKIRQYEKELGTLRSIMKGYINQIDSLNTLNKKLTADAAAARAEAAESRRANEELAQQIQSLSGQVAAGSVIKGRGLHLTAYTSHDKSTDRSGRAAYLVASLSLVENDIAERGPVRVYVRVKDPNGTLLLNSASPTFTFSGELMSATASREVDYEGREVDLNIYIKEVGLFTKGIYTAEAFTDKGQIGSTELMLR